ncbi:MAG: response regulator transcription factor [Chloroflexota bacterium]
MASILIIDDDVDLALLLAHVLRLEGYGSYAAHDAQSGIDVARRESPDLVVLDLKLPDMSGTEVLRRLRQQSPVPVPVVMLSANTTQDTVADVLEKGADDYVTKPFQPRQLLARIRAVLRRAGRAEATDQEPLVAGPIVLDPRTREVLCNDQPVRRLTATEFRLLHYLVANAGRVQTSDEIVRHVWGFAGAGNEGLVRVHVSRLRRKLAPWLNGRSLLVNHPRVGYSLAIH